MDELPDGALVALDTMVFIYFVERNQRYYTLLRPVFERISTGTIQAHASVISLLEVLVLPFSTPNAELEREYRELLSWSQLKLHVVDELIAEMAARIRASDARPDIRDEQRIRVADSIVASTALSNDCTHLITNDKQLRRITGVRVLLLDDYVEQETSV